jgi:hypothetical protein
MQGYRIFMKLEKVLKKTDLPLAVLSIVLPHANAINGLSDVWLQ